MSIKQTIQLSLASGSREMYLVDSNTGQGWGRIDLRSYCVRGAMRFARQQVRVIERCNNISVQIQVK